MNTECLVAVMMIKEARISETSAKICRAICHISEYSHIHIRRRENLKALSVTALLDDQSAFVLLCN